MNTTEQTNPPLSFPPSPPNWTETIDEVGPVIGAPAVYGPPVMFVMGPWLLLVLLLVPPFALAFTVVLVVAVTAGLLAALAALLASPYLLVRHLLAHRPVRPSTTTRRAPRLTSRAVAPWRSGAHGS